MIRFTNNYFSSVYPSTHRIFEKRINLNSSGIPLFITALVQTHFSEREIAVLASASQSFVFLCHMPMVTYSRQNTQIGLRTNKTFLILLGHSQRPNPTVSTHLHSTTLGKKKKIIWSVYSWYPKWSPLHGGFTQSGALCPQWCTAAYHSTHQGTDWETNHPITLQKSVLSIWSHHSLRSSLPCSYYYI